MAPSGLEVPSDAATSAETDDQVRSINTALLESINAIIRADTIEEIIESTLEVVRSRFGMVYGSYWALDQERDVLVFSMESGDVGAEFRRVSRSSRFVEGEGLNGRAWHERELVYVDDLGDLTDCSRATVARRAGIRSGIALPILSDIEVLGTLDFFADQGKRITEAIQEALRTIVRLASDKVTELTRRQEMTRVAQMIENAPTSMMYTDRDLKVRYMNPASKRLLKRIEAYLPVKAEDMLGQSIDIFHKNPEHQRRILADPRNLPHQARIRIGPEHADLLVSAILDRKGNYLGPMLTWDLVTERVEAELRENEAAVDTTAVNTLLVALSRARTAEEVFSLALTSLRESFGCTYGSVWTLDPSEGVLKFSRDSGTRRRGVPPQDGGDDLPRGRRLDRPGLASARRSVPERLLRTAKPPPRPCGPTRGAPVVGRGTHPAPRRRSRRHRLLQQYKDADLGESAGGPAEHQPADLRGAGARASAGPARRDEARP